MGLYSIRHIMICWTHFQVTTIIQNEAYFILALKDNQETLFQDMESILLTHLKVKRNLKNSCTYLDYNKIKNFRRGIRKYST